MIDANAPKIEMTKTPKNTTIKEGDDLLLYCTVRHVPGVYGYNTSYPEAVWWMQNSTGFYKPMKRCRKPFCTHCVR